MGAMSGVKTDPQGPALSQDALRSICDFLYRRTGLSYGEAKRYYIERRVSDGIGRTGAFSAADYIARLQADGREAERFINSFTVNETYFYREEHQLRLLGRSLLPEIVARHGPGDRVRIWSVPCASGEEPYSIALWLLENWALVDAYNIEIVGSDIDTAMVAAAQSGHYGDRALARLPASVVARYFTLADEGRCEIIQDIRESVKFTQVNIVDGAAMAAQGRFDIVFCRNVLIYFDDASRLSASHNLYEALNPGGFLCLGHSESMARISDRYITRRFDEGVVYQRGAP